MNNNPTLQKTQILIAMMPLIFCFNNSLLDFADSFTSNVNNLKASITITESSQKEDINYKRCKSKHPDENEELYRLKTIVIDAGHGGHDGGCIGQHSIEKDIALKISKQLALKMKQTYPRLKIILTREDDTFIPLYKRAKIANENNADLFISIHCNASGGGHQAHGTETFVMGLHTASQNLQVVKRENASVYLEENYELNYPFDPNSDEGHIMTSMIQHSFLNQSILFAKKVEEQFQVKEKRKSRGVKQAGFVVLKLTKMPSVLIETGFLTNFEEENYLSTVAGQQRVVQSIFSAFIAYKAEVEEEDFNAVSSIQNESWENSTANMVEKPSSRSSNPKKYNTTNAFSYTPSKPKTSSYEIQPKKIDKKFETKKKVIDPKLANIQFRIQLAVSGRLMDTREPRWKNLNHQVEVVKEGNLYKYQARNFKNYDAAEREKFKLRTSGFPEAFIVAYQNGKQINVATAKKALGLD